MLETRQSREKLVNRTAITFGWVFGLAFLVWYISPIFGSSGIWGALLFVGATLFAGMIVILLILIFIAIGGAIRRWVERGKDETN